jgi:hypothetical protein
LNVCLFFLLELTYNKVERLWLVRKELSRLCVQEKLAAKREKRRAEEAKLAGASSGAVILATLLYWRGLSTLQCALYWGSYLGSA